MHLTDEQLNEYLDNETAERAVLEAHLAACVDCATRLSALQTLFAELESLPEVELTRPLAARFGTTPGLPTQLPRWLTLTALLQAVVAVLALVVAAPFVVRLLPVMSTPSPTDLIAPIQAQWFEFLAFLASFQFPTLPQTPTFEVPSLMLASLLVASSLLWLVGNGLLLKRQA